MDTLHLSAKVFDGSKLQLLYGSFAPAELGCDLADAFLLHKAHVNHAKLGLWQPVYQLKQHRAAFDFFRRGPIRTGNRISRFSPAALPVIRNRSRCDSQKPRREGHAAPFKSVDSGQSFTKNFSGQVLGLSPISDLAGDVGVDPVEIAFVQLVEARRIPLCSFDQRAIVGSWTHGLVRIIRL